jgi:hypothetical protein
VSAEGTKGADARMLAQGHLTTVAGAAFSTGINDLLATGAVLCFVGALCAILVRRKDFLQQPPPPAPTAAQSDPEVLAGTAS